MKIENVSASKKFCLLPWLQALALSFAAAGALSCPFSFGHLHLL